MLGQFGFTNIASGVQRVKNAIKLLFLLYQCRYNYIATYVDHDEEKVESEMELEELLEDLGKVLEATQRLAIRNNNS